MSLFVSHQAFRWTQSFAQRYFCSCSLGEGWLNETGRAGESECGNKRLHCVVFVKRTIQTSFICRVSLKIAVLPKLSSSLMCRYYIKTRDKEIKKRKNTKKERGNIDLTLVYKVTSSQITLLWLNVFGWNSLCLSLSLSLPSTHTHSRILSRPYETIISATFNILAICTISFLSPSTG